MTVKLNSLVSYELENIIGKKANLRFPLNPDHPHDPIFRLGNQTLTFDYREEGKDEVLIEASHIFTDEYISSLKYSTPRLVTVVHVNDYKGTILEFWENYGADEAVLVAEVARPVIDLFFNVSEKIRDEEKERSLEYALLQ